MNSAKLVWKNFKAIHDKLDKYDKKRVKNARTATRVEGFRLATKLREEVREAQPGGKSLHPLTQMARRTKTGRLRKYARKPLAPLAPLVRYKVTRESNKFNVEVGFVSPKMGTRSWKKLVTTHQEGGVAILYGGSRTKLGIRMARIGAKLLKRRDPDAKFFFLRKDGRKHPKLIGNLPPRPEIDPFWNAYKTKAQKNIISNFERKMKGERI